MGDEVDQPNPPGGEAAEPRPLAHRSLSEPHRDRLSPTAPDYAEIVRAHGDALRDGAASYVDPRSGLVVLTAGYLARRGSCCESGCRHCPYVE